MEVHFPISMEVGRAADEDGDELAGASERQPKRSGVWNRYDDAAAAGIFAAARAAGATGAGIKYGEVNYKIWFRPQGDEPTEVADKFRALQMATADARLAELERRNAGMFARAQKEKQRKLRQKAAKKAARDEQHSDAKQQSTVKGLSKAPPHAKQQSSTAARAVHPKDDPVMAEDERMAATSAAFLIEATSTRLSGDRLQRVAKLRDKQWQLMVPTGTRAATMDEQQLGHALATARSEQQRRELLQPQQQGPPAKGKAAAAARFSPAGHQPMDTQPVQAEEDMGFALHDDI
jgi:hypothetical protein